MFPVRWALLLFLAAFSLGEGDVVLPGENDASGALPDTCTETARQCGSCSELSLRFQTQYGPVTANVSCDASSGLYCSYSLRDCSAKRSFCSLGARFQCQQTGLFPDPFDCNIFHRCNRNSEGVIKEDTQVCPLGTAYNAETYHCDLKATSDICDGFPVPECNTAYLEVKPLPQNPNIYYVCFGPIPQLFRCMQGTDYVYDGELFTCVHK